jgi:hypothetical protein
MKHLGTKWAHQPIYKIYIYINTWSTTHGSSRAPLPSPPLGGGDPPPPTPPLGSGGPPPVGPSCPGDSHPVIARIQDEGILEQCMGVPPSWWAIV